MPLYNVTVTVTTTVVVQADDEEHASQVGQENAMDAIETDRPDPEVSVRGKVTSESHLRDGWDGNCLPYGGDGSTSIKELLASEAVS